MRLYTVRFTHKIAPSDADKREGVAIRDGAFGGRLVLAAELRKLGILGKGESLWEMRIEGDKVLAFPTRRSIWHCITIIACPQKERT